MEICTYETINLLYHNKEMDTNTDDFNMFKTNLQYTYRWL
jgi:hypothetical protein